MLCVEQSMRGRPFAKFQAPMEFVSHVEFCALRGREFVKREYKNAVSCVLCSCMFVVHECKASL